MLQRLVEGDTELKISLWKLADHRDSDHLNSAIRKKTNAIFLTSEKKNSLKISKCRTCEYNAHGWLEGRAE